MPTPLSHRATPTNPSSQIHHPLKEYDPFKIKMAADYGLIANIDVDYKSAPSMTPIVVLVHDSINNMVAGTFTEFSEYLTAKYSLWAADKNFMKDNRFFLSGLKIAADYLETRIQLLGDALDNYKKAIEQRAATDVVYPSSSPSEHQAFFASVNVQNMMQSECLKIKSLVKRYPFTISVETSDELVKSRVIVSLFNFVEVPRELEVRRASSFVALDDLASASADQTAQTDPVPFVQSEPFDPEHVSVAEVADSHEAEHIESEMQHLHLSVEIPSRVLLAVEAPLDPTDARSFYSTSPPMAVPISPIGFDSDTDLDKTFNRKQMFALPFIISHFNNCTQSS